MLIRLQVGLLPLIYSPVQNLSQVLKKTFQEEQNITVFLCLCLCLCLRSLRSLRSLRVCASSYRLLVLILVLWASTLVRFFFTYA